MNIVGCGNISSTVSGQNTTYTATPEFGYLFKYFTYGGNNYTDNPITVDTSTDISVTFYFPLVAYLKGLVGFDIPDDSLNVILLKRNVHGNDDVVNIDVKTKDLLYADVLMYGTSIPSSYGGEEDSDNGWTHKESSRTVTTSDKKRWDALAKIIYQKYRDTSFRTYVNIHRL